MARISAKLAAQNANVAVFVQPARVAMSEAR